MAFNITPSLSIAYMFGNWLNDIVKSEKTNIRVGVCALLTAIWHVRMNLSLTNHHVSPYSCRLSL
jgi:hypothetical protein